ncbi:MAG: biopolymer transporter ExbD [Wenzhouxiangellaceae bacterium]|jgi:biopolymer transport protein ExbD|nr:biopolymer transporter ExbD [Wenzhouxiangellaceae bacterium]MBS3746635.1 biopolymer transporter ExbD [Wenzhouxiangellaceae bacterium]MBS3823449.1 biopolymer transporter ExbD [Wenzhouxiangellaceae bacterium]
MRRRQRPEDEAEINITPMLDVVFIMLIFFIVTTSFVREKGLDISRPQQSDQQKVEEDIGQILVEIDALSQISVNKRSVDNRAVRANLEREHAQQPKAPLIVASHPDANTNSLVTVLDAANLIGISNISVATTQ